MIGNPLISCQKACFVLSTFQLGLIGMEKLSVPTINVKVIVVDGEPILTLFLPHFFYLLYSRVGIPNIHGVGPRIEKFPPCSRFFLTFFFYLAQIYKFLLPSTFLFLFSFFFFLFLFSFFNSFKQNS